MIVPAKEPAAAKTRLGLDHPTRRALARALATDVITASVDAGVGEVLVVGTAPPGSGAVPVMDPGTGLNTALAAGAAAASADCVLALLGDLPCVRPDDIERLVTAAEARIAAGARSVFVSDAAGVGTAALAAARGDFRPRFGHRSRARHRVAGGVELTDPRLYRVRRDVDSLADLADALRIGAGAATRAAVRELGLVPLTE